MSVRGRLWIPLAGTVTTVAFAGMCAHTMTPDVPPATATELAASLGEVTSSTIPIRWERVRGMQGVRILLAAEPPATEGGPLAGAVEIANLSSDAFRHDAGPIAPGVDAFLRVEMRLPSGTETVDLHARTLGGPGARLDTPVRSVAFVAPDVLKLVLADGDGEDWAEDDWTVEDGEGTEIRVLRVHRHSYPVAQPDYEVGFDARNEIDTVDVDHTIFLRLASAAQSGQVLHVEGPDDVGLWLPFSDRYLETPTIQLNQVGYNPRARRRWAYVSAWLGDGGGLPLDGFPREAEILREPASPTERRTDPVATLPIRSRARQDEDAGTEVREINLGGVPAAEGVTYRIRIPGIGISYPTQISEIAAFKTFYVVARGLYHNRWAGDLTADHTEWPRAPDHLRVFTSDRANAFEMHPANTPRTGAREIRGGHHDAGDFDIRPSHTAVAQVLMRAYELDPERYGDGQLTIPESGNGIPDLLDEALWSVAGWKALQEEDGGVRSGVESHRHPLGYYFAQDDPLPYWTYGRDAKVSARVAGLFAQASRLVAPFDADEARDLRRRAERAFSWAEQRGDAGVFVLYGAGELFRLTGEERYGRAFEQAYWAMGSEGAFNNYSLNHLSLRDYREARRVMPDHIIGYLLAEGGSPELKTRALRWMDRQAQSVVNEILESRHAHRNARSHYPPDWGQGVTPGRNLDPVFARLSLGNVAPTTRQQYLDAISVAADYVLGANPAGMVWITGLGSRFPQRPLHTDSLVWLKRGRSAVPGIPVYGPVNGLPGNHYYRPGEAAFHPAFSAHPPMRRYGDIRTFVTNNEFTVWETQAPHTEHFAALIGAGMSPPRSWLPGQPDHANPLPTVDAAHAGAGAAPRGL